MHLQQFPKILAAWRDDALAEKWRKIRTVRRAVTGALEIERAGKRIGSSLEADPIVHVSDPDLFAALVDVDLAEICITSAATLVVGRRPGRRVPAARRRGRRRRGQARRRHQVRALLEGVARGRQRSRNIPSDAARRAGVARVAHAAQPGGGVARRMLWGPLARLGLATAAATAVLDQALKLWLLFVFDLQNRGIVNLTPFLDLVLIWNRGISYGMFQQRGPYGQWVLLALNAVAVVLLWIWLARSTSRLMVVSLGLIIGGAVGNAIDRAAYGAVADFVLLHLTTGSSASNGTSLIWPTSPSLPGWPDFCMNSSGWPARRKRALIPRINSGSGQACHCGRLSTQRRV